MQALPMLLMAGGSLVQGLSGYQAGKYNQKIANVNADAADNQGVAEGERVRSEARAAMGRQYASLGGNGLDPNSGSALTRLQESAISAELDIQEARRKARTQAMAYRAQGATAAAEGRSKLVGGLFGAAKAVTHVGDYAQLGAQYGYGGGQG